jgi:hypothetical protein
MANYFDGSYFLLKLAVSGGAAHGQELASITLCGVFEKPGCGKPLTSRSADSKQQMWLNCQAGGG